VISVSSWAFCPPRFYWSFPVVRASLLSRKILLRWKLQNGRAFNNTRKPKPSFASRPATQRIILVLTYHRKEKRRLVSFQIRIIEIFLLRFDCTYLKSSYFLTNLYTIVKELRMVFFQSFITLIFFTTSFFLFLMDKKQNWYTNSCFIQSVL